MKSFLAGFFLIGFFGSGWAQSNECEQTLNVATDEFNAGHFYGIPFLLKSCLDRNGFTNEQKVRAYLLLCQAYLIIDDPIAAEDSYLKLLEADPEYVATNEKDPVDVVYLSKKFTSTAIFTPSIRVGMNTSFYRPIYDLTTQSKPDEVRHIIKPGVQFGVSVDWNITDKVALTTGGIFSSKAFKVVRTGIARDDRLEFTEKQFWLDIPLLLKYADTKGQIRPYGYAGGALNMILSATAPMEYLNASPSVIPPTQTNAPGPPEKLTYNRRFLNYSLVVGGGARYKIGRDFLFADLRYMMGLTNLSLDKGYLRDQAAGGEPITSNALSQYRYVDGYFRLDNLSISFGYIHPLYQPRKIKTRGTKSVSKEIRKEQGNDENK